MGKQEWVRDCKEAKRTEKQREAEKTDVWWGKKEPVNTPEL